jgi:hypothetical protein
MDRDNKGRFVKDNQTVRGLKHAFKPRKKRNLYKIIGELILNNSTEEELLQKIHQLPIELQFKTIMYFLEQSNKESERENEIENNRPIDIVIKAPYFDLD